MLRSTGLGAMAEPSPTTSNVRSPPRCQRRSPARSRCRNREHAAVADIGVSFPSAVIATRGERLVTQSAYVPRPVSSTRSDTADLNVVEIDADSGSSRRHRSTPTTSTLPSTSSTRGTSPARRRPTRNVVGHRAGLRRIQSARTSRDDGLGLHRSSTARNDRGGRSWPHSSVPCGTCPNSASYMEAVHRLSDLGAVVTHVANGVTQEGFEAEWRIIVIFTVDGDLINRCELFDEADLDAALARFDELNRPAPRLENAASRVVERYWRIRGPRLGRDGRDTGRRPFSDDRRRVVNAGIRRGRDVEIADMRAIADRVDEHSSDAVIATRGKRLVLGRVRFSGREQSEAVVTDVLGIVEIDADERIAATVVFDLDDIDAAFEELDARYLAGEAAAFRTPGRLSHGTRRVQPARTPPAAPTG